MRRRIITAALALIVCVAAVGMAMPEAHASGMRLIGTNEFLQSFNVFTAITGTSHVLSLETAETSRFSDHVLVKAVFNRCEILSLTLTLDSKDVTSIHCTWSTLAPGYDRYADDFAYLLMEVLCAAGMEVDDITDLFTELGTLNAFNDGDSGEYVKGGIRVSYTSTKTFGISFDIKRA